MRRLLIVMLLFQFHFGISQNISKEKIEGIDRHIQKEMAKNNLPGVAYVIVGDGKIIAEKAFGNADDAGRKLTTRTPFELNSLTKSITALAILQLSEKGKIDLDAPVINYLPWFQSKNKELSDKITIRHLLYHQSGFTHLQGAYALAHADTTAAALENLVRGYKNFELDFQPGSAENYSNINFNILGLLIETLEHTSYEKYVEENIFQPLGMKDSFINPIDPKAQNRAMPHQFWFGQPVQHQPEPTRIFSPSGSAFSSAHDLGNYLIALIKKDTTLITDSDYSQIFDVAKVPRASEGEFGWYRGKSVPTTFSHSGIAEGTETFMFLDVKDRLGMAILANAGSHGFGPSTTANVFYGSGDILQGRSPGNYKNSLYQIVYWLLVFFCLLFLGLVFVMIIRWKRQAKAAKRHKIVGSFLLAGIISFLCLYYIPRTVGDAPLETALMFVPDVSWMLILLSTLSCIWAILKSIRALR